MTGRRSAPKRALTRWHVYILGTVEGTLYTGITTDVARRRREHAGSSRGARFFRIAAPARLLFVERHATRSSASKREAAIKRLPRQAKLALIASRSGRNANRGARYVRTRKARSANAASA